MTIVKKIVKVLLAILLLANIFIIVSGKTYLYKGLANTYLKGRSGPSIEEYQIFHNREIKSGSYLPIPNGADYNKKTIDTKAFEPYATVAYLIIKNDSVRYEQYWDGYGDSSYSNSFSMAKSFVGVLIGCAIQDGYIKSIDQPVGDFLPKFKVGNNAKLTIRHLLTMSSGINFDEDYVNPFAYPAQAYFGTDIKKLTLGYDVTEEPGKVFKYLSGNTELLGMILEQASGKKLSDYMSQRLWQALGAKNSAWWSLDHEGGTEKAYCCFNSNARDFSRFGSLYLHNGNWKGKQLVPEDFVKQATQAASLLDENGTPNTYYGYQWWVLDYKGHHIPYCRGILGQYVIAIPDKNMVIVRLGHNRDDKKLNNHPKDLYLYIDRALEAY